MGLLDDKNPSPGGYSDSFFSRIADVTDCLNTCGVPHWIGFPDSFQFPWSKLEPLNDSQVV